MHRDVYAKNAEKGRHYGMMESVIGATGKDRGRLFLLLGY